MSAEVVVLGFVDGEISGVVFKLEEVLGVLVAVIVVEVEVLDLVSELEEEGSLTLDSNCLPRERANNLYPKPKPEVEGLGFVDGEISDLVFELKEALSVLVAVVVVEVEVLGLAPELEEEGSSTLAFNLSPSVRVYNLDCEPEEGGFVLAEEEVLSLSSQAEGESFILIEDENLGCLSLKFEETGFVLIDGEVLCLVPEVEEVG